MGLPKPPVEIEEIMGRSEQGVTRPFLCRGDDGLRYYVKGVGANRRSLICEWLGGTLARGFGLNIPPFEIAHVPIGLADLLADGRELGAGAVFASCAWPNLNEILYSELSLVPQDVRRDVAAFDWWTRNADRTLSATGGNPNLLWNAAEGELVVIDHNQAFDPEFDAERFLETHVFRADLIELRSDLASMAQYSERMSATLDLWDPALAMVPEEWYFHDDEQTIPIEFDPVASLVDLARCRTEELWRLP